MPKMFEAEPLMRLFQNGAKSNRGTWNGLAYYHAQKILERQPTVEAEPVRHGFWEKDEYGSHLRRCSCCKKHPIYKDPEHAVVVAVYAGICINCGAKMDGGT